MKKNVSTHALMQWCAALAATGAVPLFHIFDITPEILFDPYKYGKKNITEEVTQTEDEIEKEYRELNTTRNTNIDFVSIGCRHSTIAVAQSALLREDSRGAHFSEDFPKRKPEMAKGIFVKRDKGEIKVSF